MTCLKSTALLAVFAHIARAGKWSRIFCTLHAVGLYYSLNRHMEYIRQIIEKSTIRLTSVELAQACPNDLIKVQIIELVFSIVYSLFCVHQLWSSHCCTIISRLVVSLSRSTSVHQFQPYMVNMGLTLRSLGFSCWDEHFFNFSINYSRRLLQVSEQVY